MLSYPVHCSYAKITQRNNIRRAKHLWSSSQFPECGDNFRHRKTQTKHMEGALRCSLGSQAQHTHSLEDHTWSIQQNTTTHTKHIHNIQQKMATTPKHIVNCFTKQFTNTQHTKQTDILRVQHTRIQHHTHYFSGPRGYKKSKNNNSQGPDKLNIWHLNT